MDVPYEIKYSYNGDFAQLMKESYLPFQLNGNLLITDATYATEKYLQWLIKNDVQIQSVNPIKRNLEELYRDFYNV